MKKYFFSTLLAVVFFVSCSKNRQQEFTDPTKSFSIEAAQSLKREKGLNDEAQLQIADKARELYLIALIENKKEVENTFLESQLITEGSGDSLYAIFSDTALQMLLNTVEVENANEIILSDFEINGLPAKQTSFVANINGLQVYYVFTAIDGKKDFYQLLTWTLEEYKDKAEVEMKSMITSFKEK